MHTQSLHYEIRIERYLGPGIVALFPEFVLSEQEGITTLRGMLPDQAALHGVLNRIRDLGLTLIELRQIEAQEYNTYE